MSAPKSDKNYENAKKQALISWENSDEKMNMDLENMPEYEHLDDMQKIKAKDYYIRNKILPGVKVTDKNFFGGGGTYSLNIEDEQVPQKQEAQVHKSMFTKFKDSLNK